MKEPFKISAAQANSLSRASKSLELIYKDIAKDARRGLTQRVVPEPQITKPMEEDLRASGYSLSKKMLTQEPRGFGEVEAKEEMFWIIRW